MADTVNGYIVGVRYDPTATYITAVCVQEVSGAALRPRVLWQRSTVVDAILSGKVYKTAFLRFPSQQLQEGETVRVIEVGGIHWLRTDSNSTATDNLESLPPC